MTAGLTAALAVAAALGISFRTTRGIGIASFAGLVFLFPWLAVPVVIAIAAVLARQSRRRDRRS
jgi:hypothetical protein